MSKLTCILSILILLFSCESTVYPGKPYYFPVEYLAQHPTIYRYYHPSNDSIAPEIWLMNGVQTDTGLFLESTLFEGTSTIVQTSSDKMAENGSLLRQIALFFPDSLGNMRPVKGQVLEPAGFLFTKHQPNELTLLKVRFKISEAPRHIITLSRARQFRKDTIISVLGRQYPALSFNLTEHIDDEQDGHLELTYPGYEVFAKGLGRVYYKKAIKPGYTIEFLLKDTISVFNFKRQSDDQIPSNSKNE